MTPSLVAVAHGTRDPRGVATVRGLLARVRAMRRGLTVEEAYAELAAPALDGVLADVPGPVVVVPLLLVGGYHATVDIPRTLARVRPDAVPARPLGPHPLLAEALADRLAAAGLGRGDTVVLGAAGSTDPSAVADVGTAARQLAGLLRRPVWTGFAAGATPRLPDVVRRLRATGSRRVVVASYLIAPGHFHTLVRACGADAVSEPLGAHPAVAELLLARYDRACATWPAAPASGHAAPP